MPDTSEEKTTDNEQPSSEPENKEDAPETNEPEDIYTHEVIVPDGVIRW